jgi:hypothetical protein
MKNLLSIDTNAKTVKGQAFGYITAILYLAPHKISGKNLCAFATKGCSAACLYSAGRGKFSNVQQARIKKAQYFLSNRESFLIQLGDEITKLVRKYGSKLAIRLNGTSDIPFEQFKVFEGKNIFEYFSNVTFYDYTKNPRRMYLDIPNYSLTFSRAETDSNITWSRLFLKEGKNVAAVFDQYLYKDILTNQNLYFQGTKINLVDGDQTDLRFLDKKGSLIVLKAKGDAKKDKSNFVVTDYNLL